MIGAVPQFVTLAIGYSISPLHNVATDVILAFGFLEIVMMVSLKIVPHELVCVSLILYVPWLLILIFGVAEVLLPVKYIKLALESPGQVLDKLVIDHVYGVTVQLIEVGEVLFKAMEAGAQRDAMLELKFTIFSTIQIGACIVSAPQPPIAISVTV